MGEYLKVDVHFRESHSGFEVGEINSTKPVNNGLTRWDTIFKDPKG
jgi:hypothetical protein